MANPWDPTHPVDRDLARRLIDRALPELAGAPIERVGEGWDVDVWRVGDLAFRFPRRPLGVECIANEIRLLPALAPRLPLRIPKPELIGSSSPEYPYPWFGHAFLAGTTADRARLSNAERLAIAEPLAAFLRALHAIPVDEARALGAEPDKLRRDLDVVRSRTHDRLAALERSRFGDALPRIRAALARLPAPASEPDIVIHGDVYARHLILDGRELSAVIDWGDVCLGDRAVDLDVAYSFFPAVAREAFFDAYGPVDAATRERARFFALNRHAVALLAYALDVDDAPLLEEAERALQFAMQ